MSRKIGARITVVTHCETPACVFGEKPEKYILMLPEQNCAKCGRRMLLYHCSHNNCPTERRLCVVCEYGGIRPPIPFAQTSIFPECHSDGMLLADENRNYL